MILVTLVCCYAACWGPTKTRGVLDVTELVNEKEPEDDPLANLFGPSWDTSAMMPLLVRADYRSDTRHYYFWFFGYVAKLPYERDIKPVVNGVSGAT